MKFRKACSSLIVSLLILCVFCVQSQAATVVGSGYETASGGYIQWRYTSDSVLDLFTANSSGVMYDTDVGSISNALAHSGVNGRISNCDAVLLRIFSRILLSISRFQYLVC